MCFVYAHSHTYIVSSRTSECIAKLRAEGLTKAQNPLRSADQVLLLSIYTHYSRSALLSVVVVQQSTANEAHCIPHMFVQHMCSSRSAYIFKNSSSRFEFPYTLEPSNMQRETSNAIALQYQTMCKYLIYRLPQKSNNNQNSTYLHCQKKTNTATRSRAHKMLIGSFSFYKFTEYS